MYVIITLSNFRPTSPTIFRKHTCTQHVTSQNIERGIIVLVCLLFSWIFREDKLRLRSMKAFVTESFHIRSLKDFSPRLWLILYSVIWFLGMIRKIQWLFISPLVLFQMKNRAQIEQNCDRFFHEGTKALTCSANFVCFRQNDAFASEDEIIVRKIVMHLLA